MPHVKLIFQTRCHLKFKRHNFAILHRTLSKKTLNNWSTDLFPFLWTHKFLSYHIKYAAAPKAIRPIMLLGKFRSAWADKSSTISCHLEFVFWRLEIIFTHNKHSKNKWTWESPCNEQNTHFRLDVCWNIPYFHTIMCF